MPANRKTSRRPEQLRKAGSPHRLATMKQAIMVLGMHRSGTSALTRVLSLLGADLPKNVMGPGIGNDTGHWESADLVIIHDAMLDAAGTSWHDWRKVNPDWIGSAAAEAVKQQLLTVIRNDFTHSNLFTVKDPRICRFVPLWRDVLDRFDTTPVPVLPIRNPLEVAASLRRRNGFALTKSYLLWLRHTLDAERTTREMPRAIVTYDMLMDDWRALVARISETTDLRWPRRTDSTELAVDRFLADAHRHHVTDETQLNARADVTDWVKTTYGALLAMSRGPEREEHHRILDQVSAEFNKATTAFGLLLAGEIEDAEARIRDIDARIATIAGERDAAIAERDASLAEANNAFTQARQLATDYATRVRALDEELVATRGRAHEAETEAAARRQEAERRQQELEATRALLRESQTEAQRLAGESEQAQKQLDEARQVIKVINTERDAARTLAATRESDLATAHRRLLEALNDAQARAHELKHVSQELGDTTEQLQAAATDLQHLRSEAEKTTLLLADQNKALAATRADGEKTRRELGLTQSILRDARRENGLITAALEEAQRIVQDGRQERSQLGNELIATREVLYAAQAELQSVREVRDFLQCKADEATRAENEVTRLRATVQQTWAQAQRDLTARSEETARLQRELTSLRAEAEAERLKRQADEQKRRDAAQARRSVWPFSRLRQRAMTARQHQETEAIRRSGLFDPLWYLKRYPDVAATGQDPLMHYVLHGGAEGRDPHPLFDGKWYIAQYADYTVSCLSPLGHYVVEGVTKGYDPNPLFDTDWYLRQYPDIAASSLNPLHHFWTVGASHGLDPNPMFDTSWYLEKNPDVKRAGENPLAHYRTHGWREARAPHPLFDYRRHPGIKPGFSLDPLEEYLINRAASN